MTSADNLIARQVTAKLPEGQIDLKSLSGFQAILQIALTAGSAFSLEQLRSRQKSLNLSLLPAENSEPYSTSSHRASWGATVATLLSLQLGWGLWLMPHDFARQAESFQVEQATRLRKNDGHMLHAYDQPYIRGLLRLERKKERAWGEMTLLPEGPYQKFFLVKCTASSNAYIPHPAQCKDLPMPHRLGWIPASASILLFTALSIYSGALISRLSRAAGGAMHFGDIGEAAAGSKVNLPSPRHN